MADVGKISGPGNPTDPFAGKEPLNINAEKFQKHVEKIDTEQKKKQKKQKKISKKLKKRLKKLLLPVPNYQKNRKPISNFLKNF